MWMDKLPSGKYNYIERYIDPMTGKKKRVSIAFDTTGISESLPITIPTFAMIILLFFSSILRQITTYLPGTLFLFY